MASISPIMRFRNSVAAACGAIGVPADSVLVSASGVSLPDAGITVSLAISDQSGQRVWRAVETYLVHGMGGREPDREITTILSEEPLGREMAMARRIAVHIAEGRIDAALDATA